MNIVKNDRRKEKLSELEKYLNEKKDNHLYIWGASQTACMITDFCNQNSSLTVAGYIVDDAYYREDTFCDKPVYKTSEWVSKAKSKDVVIYGFTNYERAKKVSQTLPEGILDVYFHFPYSANVDGTYLTYDDYQGAEQGFQEAYDCLDDDLSKDVMEAFINACISGDADKLESLRTDGQYFNELTKNMSPGCFVDLGAYIGDTIEEAFAFYGKRLEKVVAFEPDGQNLVQLKERMERCGVTDERLQLVRKGSWNCAGVLHFSSSDSSSSISEEGDIEIEVDAVDAVLQNQTVPVSYIKMDVEGSEFESLQGAQGSITEGKPILAVCVYHKPDDLYRLTDLIRQFTQAKGYRYYMRYHGPDLREVVFYAIPIDVKEGI